MANTFESTPGPGGPSRLNPQISQRGLPACNLCCNRITHSVSPSPAPTKILDACACMTRTADKAEPRSDSARQKPNVGDPDRKTGPFMGSPGRRMKGIAASTDGHHPHTSVLRACRRKSVACNVPLNVTQKCLGHARISATSTYTEAVGAEEKLIADRMPD